MRARVERRTVNLSAYPDLVVIYLGMRVNRIAGIKTLLGFGPKISSSAVAQPDGLLRHETVGVASALIYQPGNYAQTDERAILHCLGGQRTHLVEFGEGGCAVGATKHIETWRRSADEGSNVRRDTVLSRCRRRYGRSLRQRRSSFGGRTKREQQRW